MDVVKKPIGDLSLDPSNARAHPVKNLDAIKASLRRFGLQKPIVVDAAGVVIAGNGTLAAAVEIGWEHIDCVISPLKGSDRTAYGIADNRTTDTSDWDDGILGQHLEALEADGWDLDELGFDKQDLAELITSNDTGGGITDPDDVPDEVDPVCKAGQLWKLGEHRLLCGDCTVKENVERLMDGKKAQCVFTSPPYAVGVNYRSYNDTIENLRGMLPKLADNWIASVVSGGYAVINFADIGSAKGIVDSKEPCEYPMAIEYWPVFIKAGWLLWSRRVWCKHSANTSSMQCILSNRAATNWENIWTWKKPGKPLHDKQISGEFASQRGWIDSTNMHKLDIGLDQHGAGMPVGVAEYMISVHSFVNGIVIEPFCGSGSTLIACEKTNRKCYGMEIDPHYCDVITKRWEDFTGKKAELIDGRQTTETD